MGLMRFLIHPQELLGDWPELQRAYITGLDGRIYPTRVEVQDNVVTCRRTHSDSGKLHVPLPLPGVGRPVCTTTSLPEQDNPYLLTLELCRGKLAEVRDQLATWQMLGMQVPDEFEALHRSSFSRFAQASAAQDSLERAGSLALESLQDSHAAADILTHSYVEQRLAMRYGGLGHAPALLGARLDAGLIDDEPLREFCELFAATVIPVEWRDIEPAEGKYQWEEVDQLVDAAEQHRTILRAGPLIDLGPAGLPDWLSEWRHDFLNLQSFVCDYIETAVSRYLGRVRIWEVSARGNSGMVLGLSEENRLALVARTLEAAARTDSDAQFFIRIDQPWSEYQARGQHRLSAFQFVDALVRSNVGLHGVNLELAFGYRPRGSLARDLLGVSRLIDAWTQLGVQIYVTLALPSSGESDPLANPDLEVDTCHWADAWSPQIQAEQANELLRLLMAKPAVTGVFWAHYHDSQSHIYPHAGLVDRNGARKPAADVVRQLQPASPPADSSEDDESTNSPDQS